MTILDHKLACYKQYVLVEPAFRSSSLLVTNNTTCGACLRLTRLLVTNNMYLWSLPSDRQACLLQTICTAFSSTRLLVTNNMYLWNLPSDRQACLLQTICTCGTCLQFDKIACYKQYVLVEPAFRSSSLLVTNNMYLWNLPSVRQACLLQTIIMSTSCQCYLPRKN